MCAALISIIVPVYNTEKYLDQCIQSVLAQTYTNWELLLIDDGSTDSSGAICDKYVAQDSRIKVIHKENTGVSDSKNIALDMAQGDYVMFLDSDDYWCDDNCIESLVEVGRKYDADIVRGEYKAVDENGCMIAESEIPQDKFQLANRVISPASFMDRILQREFFMPLCLLKRIYLEDIRFTAGKVFLEDVECMVRILTKVNKCVYIPYRFYVYRKHFASISFRPVEEKLRDAYSIVPFYFEAASMTDDRVMYNSFIKRAITYYILTSKTIGEYSFFYKKRKNLRDKYELAKLRRMCIAKREYVEKRYYVYLLFLSPIRLIEFWHFYFRLRNRVQ